MSESPNPTTSDPVAYELSNPSDTVTFEAPSLEVAACASFILVEGQYGAFPEDRESQREVPIFLMGGAMEWYEETFGRGFDEGLTALGEKVSEALRSVWYVGLAERPTLARMLAAIPDPEERLEHLDRWNDDHRSSMNNIGARARVYAQGLHDGDES